MMNTSCRSSIEPKSSRYLLLAMIFLGMGTCHSFSTCLAGKMTTERLTRIVVSAMDEPTRRRRWRNTPGDMTTTTTTTTAQAKRSTGRISAASSSRPRRNAWNDTSVEHQARRRSSRATPSHFLENTFLNHELLTKEQEMDLGNAIRRAQQLKKSLEMLVEAKIAEQVQVEQSEAEDDDEEDDLSHLSVYGGLDDYDENFQDQQLLSRLAKDQTRLERREGNSLVSAAMDEIAQSFLLDKQLAMLTDTEVRSLLDGDGGREMVKAVLVEGSLARDTLIRSNIRLVVSIAKKWAKLFIKGTEDSLRSVYRGSWDRPSLDEAVQEGVVGLTIAVDRFEPTRNFRFSTYATWWVTNSIRRCFQRTSTGCLRIPVQFHDTKRSFMKLAKKYYGAQGRLPELDILAKDLGISLTRLQFVLQRTLPLYSTDTPVKRGATIGAGKAGGFLEENSVFMGDTLVDREPTPEDRVELSFLRQSLENAMASELAPHERDIVRLRLGLDDGIVRTVREVVHVFGDRLSMAEVRTVEKNAYKKLRSPQALSTFKLLAYLDIAGVDISTMTMR